MNRENPTVLLVEDDPNDAHLVQRAFGRLNQGVSVRRLEHGDQAIAYLSGNAPFHDRAAHPVPAFMLLDIKLPGRSGFEVLEWIRRQQDPTRRLPVVMLTSSTHTADVNRAYDMGANSYLAKPESSEGLKEMARLLVHYWLALNRAPGVSTG
ncbi:MAG: response regulator [Acidobacteria bacterium]|nr:response regulator [Acidobacteriota bacterium]